MNTAEQSQNLLNLFFERVEDKGEAPFLWAKKDGNYRAMTWRETAAQVSELARGLAALGIEAGDRVVLVSENRPEWLIADLAIMAIGAITVPAYITNTKDDHLHILSDSGARLAIVSTAKLAERLLPAAVQASALESVIAIEQPDIAQNIGIEIHMWGEVLAMGAARHENVVEQVAGIKRDDTCCLIYTSGTGGVPKGVMLSHGAILHNCTGARDALQEIGLGDEVFLSFLPLSHSYEHTAGQFFPMSIGAEIYYAEGAETLAANMIEARPTIMTAVPRLYETFHLRISRGVKAQGGMKEKLFMRAVELGCKRLDGTTPLSLAERLVDGILSILVRKKVKARFGGRLKALVSGGAPLNPDIGSFFLALGLRILQGYGLTETGPVISVNRPNQIKIDTVGRPMTAVEVKIAADGEILVRGELLMKGYWGRDEDTRECIRDGWLHTGDIGHQDDLGRLLITDRKKDIIVNSGGDNIAPQRIEGVLTLEPEISQAMVYGDKRPHLSAIIVPDPDWIHEWAKQSGGSNELADLVDNTDFKSAVGEIVDRINQRLSNI
ncbi:MAG: long-chain fatty acid--CoA ligase, partial [Rhodospirillaceae bacterium]|nr:long-chain fatty acid--CoA ligase [Rhodospirillaceae bacterium]